MTRERSIQLTLVLFGARREKFGGNLPEGMSAIIARRILGRGIVFSGSPNSNPPKYMSTARKLGGEVEKRRWRFCLSGTNPTTKATDFYILEVKNTKNNRRSRQRITPLGSGLFPSSCMHVSLGSALYCFGGINFDTHPTTRDHEMYILDTNRVEEGFKKGPPMIKGRALTSPVIFGGKIYVFGGIEAPDEDRVEIFNPFGECFDPKLGKWNPISQPPDLLSYDILKLRFVFPYDEESIMLIATHSQRELFFIYNAISNSWINFPAHTPLDTCSTPIKVGSTLYWVNGFLHAYDLVSQESYSGRIEGSVLHLYQKDEYGYPDVIDHMAPLFHLSGNEFCFFYLAWEEPHSIIYCTKFRVVKQAGGILDAKAFATQSYITDDLSYLEEGCPLDETCTVKISHTRMPLGKARTSPNKMKEKKRINNEHV